MAELLAVGGTVDAGAEAEEGCDGSSGAPGQQTRQHAAFCSNIAALPTLQHAFTRQVGARHASVERAVGAAEREQAAADAAQGAYLDFKRGVATKLQVNSALHNAIEEQVKQKQRFLTDLNAMQQQLAGAGERQGANARLVEQLLEERARKVGEAGVVWNIWVL